MNSADRQLMWIQGLLPEKIRKQITDLCIANNDDLKLSDHFLIYPLHVSFKRSFYTDRFEMIREDMKELLEGYGPIDCISLFPMKVKDMIWLGFENEEELLKIHERIDDYLLERYQIPVDEFDRNYHPHVTLFRDDDGEKLEEMLNRIRDHFPMEDVRIEEVIIGAKGKESCLYQL